MGTKELGPKLLSTLVALLSLLMAFSLLAPLTPIGPVLTNSCIYPVQLSEEKAPRKKEAKSEDRKTR